MRETGAESMRELPTLTLFKINMNLEMEKGTEALAAAVEAAPPRELDAQPYDDRRHRPDQGAAGPDGRGRAALRRGRRRARHRHRGAARAACATWSTARSCAASRRSSTTAAPASRPTGWASGRSPRTRSWRSAPAWPPSAASPTATSGRPTRTGPTASSRWPTAAPRRSATRSSTRSPTECGIGPDGRATLYSSTEYKKIRLHYFTDDYAALGGASIPSSGGAVRAGAPRPARRGQLAGAGDAADRPRADLHRARRGLRAGRRRRQPLPRLGRLLGPADPRPRRPGGRLGGDRGGQAGDELRRRHRGRGRAGRGGRRRACPRSRWCG